MKSFKKDIKSKNAVVDTIEVNTFESVNEAVEVLGLENCLSLINRQYETDLTNEARRRATNISNKTIESLLKSKGIDTSPENLRKLLEGNGD